MVGVRRAVHRPWSHAGHRRRARRAGGEGRTAGRPDLGARLRGRDRPGGRAGQQRRRDGRTAGTLRRRVRASARHQPPRPPRAGQPPAAAAHRSRGDRGLGQSPRGPDLAGLQRRLTAVGSRLRSVGGHPGYTATGIQGGTGNALFTRVGALGNALVGMRPWQGALPVLYAATMDVPGNSYLGPDGPFEMLGRPTHVGRSPAAGDPDLARAVWSESEQLTGVGFPL